MNHEEATKALFEKMQSEQDAYRNWLLQQPPEEILNHTYEFTVRADILMALETTSLSDQQTAALLKSDTPLADVYKDFSKMETGYMDTLSDVLTQRAELEAEKEQARREALKNIPIYPHTASFARENGEREQYRASHQANVACRDAIETAISENYFDNTLHKEAVQQVVEAFGFDRTLYVLANTVQHKEMDGRIDSRNKQWAKTVPIYEDGGAGNSSLDYCLHKAHPGLINIFLDTARHEYLLSQPLTVPEIREEAQRLLDRLQKLDGPNRPNGAHFMAELSPDFLARASAKDTAALQKFLPFKSLALTTMKDRKGVFAVIAGDEKRDRKLREPRASVLAKLQSAPSATAPKYSAKSRSDPER